MHVRGMCRLALVALARLESGQAKLRKLARVVTPPRHHPRRRHHHRSYMTPAPPPPGQVCSLSYVLFSPLSIWSLIIRLGKLQNW